MQQTRESSGRRRDDGTRTQIGVYGDAASAILNRPAREFTGNSVLCEDVLFEPRVTNLSVCDCVLGVDLAVDFWVDGVDSTWIRRTRANA